MEKLGVPLIEYFQVISAFGVEVKVGDIRWLVFRIVPKVKAIAFKIVFSKCKSSYSELNPVKWASKAAIF